ncbi:uncharacterized protein [Nicotiana tomentosiformis]|uniref:uncharacterized protein n=1 Tax=Nicotiana tomentosiformis TaxID=4098 RepID=UPI00388C7324
MLKKATSTSWTEECQKSFDKIKKYLSKPPVLVPPEPRRPMLLYLSVLDGAFGCVLGQHDETRRKEKAIYYLSKKFTPYEARYSLLEHTCCALTWITQKLRHYFCAYTIYLISRMDPLKYIFQKPMPMGKLAKWEILLSEFDIIYVIQKMVKGQVLADHLAENPLGGEYKALKMYFPDEEVSFIGEDITETYDGWRVFFDGAANFKGVGIGAILVSETDKNFIDPITVGIHNQPAYCAHVEEETDGNPWFHDIKEYLAKGDTEAVIPAEVEIPSLRIIQEAKLRDAEWIQSHYEQLALINGKRMNANLGNPAVAIPKTRKEFNDVDRKAIEKNFRAKKILICGIGYDEYNRILACQPAKEIWEALQTAHEGTTHVKQYKIDMLTTEYELFRMKDDEPIQYMHTRFTSIINELHSLGETIPRNKLVRKILSVLPSSWESKVNAITEAKDLQTLTIDELVGNLKTYEIK